MEEHPSGNGNKPSAFDSLSELRHLLFSPEQKKLESIQERLDDPELHAVDISRVLPDAVMHRSGQDDRLAKALAPTIESSFQVSVKRNPKVLVDVISPIMGPAIRASISHAISSMVASLNQTMEHSLSVQGLKWRVEAARTGRSFGEVVLLHTLVYRVEQVFLIHKETGLLLQHVVAGAEDAVDPDMVSGMLTAIQDFVRDSFSGGKHESLHTMRVGEMDVWIEDGPHAVLAAVIRGQAPGDLRVRFLEALEEIHQQMGPNLEAFDGDSGPFEACRPVLQETLETQFQAPAKVEKRRNPLVFLVPVLALIGIALFAYRHIDASQRFDAFITRLENTPGIVVTDVRERDGAYWVRGLRDPLAPSPSEWEEAARLTRPLELKVEPYYSFVPEFQLVRAERSLSPPGTVTLEIENAVLKAAGSADHDWVVSSRRLARALPGILHYDDSALVDSDRQVFEQKKGWVEAQIVLFDAGQTSVGPGYTQTLDSLADSVRVLLRRSEVLGFETVLQIVGQADASGNVRGNQRLSQARATSVMEHLAAYGLSSASLRAVGLGAPATGSASTGRRVTFRVVTLSHRSGERPR